MIKKYKEEFEKLESDLGLTFNPDNEKYYEQLVNIYPDIPVNEEKELFKLYREGNLDARDIIIKSNIKNVYNICTSKRGDKLDLVSAANICLIGIMDGYNYNSNISFGDFVKEKIEIYFEALSSKDNLTLKTDMSLEKLESLEEEGIIITDNKLDEELEERINYEKSPKILELINKRN